MFRIASVLLSVTTVGFDMTFVLDCVLSAEMMTLKSEAENTAVATRLVLPPLTSEFSALTADVTALLELAPELLPEVTELSEVKVAGVSGVAAVPGTRTVPTTVEGVAAVP